MTNSGRDEKRTFKVVVTGFGPFQNVPRNESWQAVSGLWSEPFPPEIKLITRELEVVYDVVKEAIPRLWEEEKPDVNTALYCSLVSVRLRTPSL